MNPQEWARVRAIFEEIAALPRDRQSQRLAELGLEPELRDQLQKMLASDARSDRLDSDLQAEVRRVEQEIDTSRKPGQTLGPYRLVRHLGDGGMGEVFLAERADGRFEAQVAIKFLALAGARARALFERERRLLARVNHPNIARLIDAGEDDKSAYLVMEFVDGLAITEYCAQAGTCVEDRLELMRQAALAVDHAHQHFVVHRDLKPPHLLVDREGRLKVLDFGIAAMLDPETGSASATSSHGFTPLYAAPEQILGEPTTTAVDVYALGLVLYELMTGRHAFGAASLSGDEASAAERKLVATCEPVRSRAELGATRDAWAGSRGGLRDLNAILQTALARQPRDRYRTPAELAADLERLARGEPVLARTQTRREAMARWIRTHRLASGAIGVAVLSLIVGSALALWSARNAALQRDEAMRQAQKAELIAHFLQDVFRSVEPSRSPDKEVSAKDILDAGIAQLGARSQSLPAEIAAELTLLFGDMLLELGKLDDAVAQYARALALAEPEGLERIVRKARLGQGRAYNSLGKFKESTAVLEYLTARAFDPTAFDEIDVRARMHLGSAYTQLGRLDEAEKLIDPLFAHTDRVLALQPNGGQLLGSLEGTRGSIYNARGDRENALKMRTLALQHLEAHFGTDLHPAVVSAIDNLANAHSVVGNDEQAHALSERSLGLTLRLYGELHPRLLIVRLNFAARLAGEGNNEAGLEQINAVFDALAKDETHPSYAWEGVAYQILALLNENLRRFDEADAATRQAIAVVTARYGEKSSRVGQCQATLGRILWKRGMHDEAKRQFQEGIAALSKAAGDDHPEVLQAQMDYLVFLADTGMFAERDALWSNPACAAGAEKRAGQHPRADAGSLRAASGPEPRASAGAAGRLPEDVATWIHVRGGPAVCRIFAVKFAGCRRRGRR